MTARFLCKETFPIQKGSRALVYAAAGGTGQILLQWIKHLGGIVSCLVFLKQNCSEKKKVIAVVSTDEKAAICKNLGADHTILSSQNIPEAVAAICGKVDVCFDSIGKDTFNASIDSLRPRGMMVSYGNA